MPLPIRFCLPLLLGASLAGACSASPAPRATDMTELLRVSEHRHGDDLLSAGLGLEGLRTMVPPAFADAGHPTAAELRRRAIWSSWRGIADLSPGGGFGTVYGAVPVVPAQLGVQEAAIVLALAPAGVPAPAALAAALAYRAAHVVPLVLVGLPALGSLGVVRLRGQTRS